MASESKTVILAALVGNALISVTKFVAAGVTGSSAMLSEGIHSVVDTGNQVLLLYGMRRGAKPPDKEFPFGHGKEIYFWSFVVAILIFAVGAGISMYEGIHHVIHPSALGDPTVNYIVLAFAMVFEGGALWFAWKAFQKSRGDRTSLEAVRTSKDPALFVVLFEDSAAMLGLIVAFVGVFVAHVTGWAWADGAASIAIGLILGGTAVWLAYETKGLLIGEAANPEVIDGIRQLATRHDHVGEVFEVLTMHMGPSFVIVNMNIHFKDDASAEDIENAVAEIDGEIKSTYPEAKRVFIEVQGRRSRT